MTPIRMCACKCRVRTSQKGTREGKTARAQAFLLFSFIVLIFSFLGNSTRGDFLKFKPHLHSPLDNFPVSVIKYSPESSHVIKLTGVTVRTRSLPGPVPAPPATGRREVSGSSACARPVDPLKSPGLPRHDLSCTDPTRARLFHSTT